MKKGISRLPSATFLLQFSSGPHGPVQVSGKWVNARTGHRQTAVFRARDYCANPYVELESTSFTFTFSLIFDPVSRCEAPQTLPLVLLRGKRPLQTVPVGTLHTIRYGPFAFFRRSIVCSSRGSLARAPTQSMRTAETQVCSHGTGFFHPECAGLGQSGSVLEIAVRSATMESAAGEAARDVCWFQDDWQSSAVFFKTRSPGPMFWTSCGVHLFLDEGTKLGPGREGERCFVNPKGPPK